MKTILKSLFITFILTRAIMPLSSQSLFYVHTISTSNEIKKYQFEKVKIIIQSDSLIAFIKDDFEKSLNNQFKKRDVTAEIIFVNEIDSIESVKNAISLTPNALLIIKFHSHYNKSDRLLGDIKKQNYSIYTAKIIYSPDAKNLTEIWSSIIEIRDNRKSNENQKLARLFAENIVKDYYLSKVMQ